MKLGFNLDFNNLKNLEGLSLIDDLFLKYLEEAELSLFNTLLKARSNPYAVKDKDYSNFLILVSPYFDDFISQLFNNGKEIDVIRRKAIEFDIIYECKRKFVQRFALKKYSKEQILLEEFENTSKALKNLLKNTVTIDSFARQIMEWWKEPQKFEYELDIAAKYAAFMVYNDSKNVLFNLPKSIDKNNLITQENVEYHRDTIRYGFDYFAPELNSYESMNQSHYCIYCHNQHKDSCSKGFTESRQETIQDLKNGCPLRQKISEMNYVKARGFDLAALAIIIIDNPMLAATGHRICNDCMSSCIYQKQEPVNVPLIESNILNTILKLSYGVEIYLLLTKWNPLNIFSFLPKNNSGYNVLIVGLGPAGFGLSHYLLNEGHNVVAIDGLKVTHLPFDINLPIESWEKHKQLLSNKIPQGFGGVAEYGITSRWDKNNLTLLRLILERRTNFKIYSGIKLDSNITAKQAFEHGFDHIAVCTGAAEPKVPVLNNFLAKGIRTASDFLMTLQNGGAFLESSITSLTLRLPIVIIGCGLTAIDCAVEALNYYPVQVEKFLKTYKLLVKKLSKEIVELRWTIEDKLIAQEFIKHAELFKNLSGEEIRKIIIEKLGGVTICYRSTLSSSQAYKLNPEEILHAQAAGVKFLENLSPLNINIDEYNYVESIDFGSLTLPAKSIIMAIGTKQNQELIPDERFSYYGDSNPKYAGSVVKALASSKNGYKNVSNILSKNSPNFLENWQLFRDRLDNLFISRIKKVNILSDKIVELIVYSPLAVKNFKPGQFFRLQNYSNNITKLMEPLALTGAYVDVQNNLISLIILEVGKSTKLCRDLIPEKEVVLMGPTGEPTQISKDINVLLIGGGLGNAVLFSIGNALKSNNCNVTYIAGYKNLADKFYTNMIENSSDQVIWCCEEDFITEKRKQDVSIKGTVIDGIKHVSLLKMPNQIICIGSQSMMKAVKDAKDKIYPKSQLICSINSPMQCMMKGVCGQCIQQVSDDRKYIFTCACQDQDAEFIDFENLKLRLEQNSLHEKLMEIL